MNWSLSILYIIASLYSFESKNQLDLYITMLFLLSLHLFFVPKKKKAPDYIFNSILKYMYIFFLTWKKSITIFPWKFVNVHEMNPNQGYWTECRPCDAISYDTYIEPVPFYPVYILFHNYI